MMDWLTRYPVFTVIILTVTIFFGVMIHKAATGQYDHLDDGTDYVGQVCDPEGNCYDATEENMRRVEQEENTPRAVEVQLKDGTTAQCVIYLEQITCKGFSDTERITP